MDVLVGEVYPIGKFVEELAGTKRRALLPEVSNKARQSKQPFKQNHLIYSLLQRIYYQALPIGLLTRSNRYPGSKTHAHKVVGGLITLINKS